MPVVPAPQEKHTPYKTYPKIAPKLLQPALHDKIIGSQTPTNISHPGEEDLAWILVTFLSLLNSGGFARLNSRYYIAPPLWNPTMMTILVAIAAAACVKAS